MSTPTTEEERLELRLLHIHNRIQWIANAEERAAWIGGFAARGGLTAEKMRLIDETDAILDKLMSKD